MIKAINKHLCVVPGFHCGVTKEWGIDKKGEFHNGTDWGAKVGYSYYEDVICPQDLIVREVGYGKEITKIGYYLTGEAQYDDNTHSFWGFIHLRDMPKWKAGDRIAAGEVIGIRGGSPYKSNGNELYTPHLHMYTTPATAVGYSWNKMKELACDPFKVYTFCKLKNGKYDLAAQDGHNFNNAPIYEDELKNDYDEVKQLKEQIERLSQDLAKSNSKLERIKDIL